MKINLYTKNLSLNNEEKKFIEEKISKLEHFCKDIIETWVELDNDTSQKSGYQKYRAEVQMKLRHSSIRAEATSGDIIAAINLTIPKLKKQIEKFKTKFRKVKKN